MSLGNNNGNSSGVRITARDREMIARLTSTEADHGMATRHPDVYKKMVTGIVDTVINRMGSPDFPNTIDGVANQDRAFSDINSPIAKYGAVTNVPASRATPHLRRIINEHIDARIMGSPSSIGDGVNYANPHYSSAKNLGWINALEGPRIGVGDSIHYHGTAKGSVPFEASVTGDIGSLQLASIDPNKILGDMSRLFTQQPITPEQMTAQYQGKTGEDAFGAQQIAQASLMRLLKSTNETEALKQAGVNIDAYKKERGLMSKEDVQALGIEPVKEGGKAPALTNPELLKALKERNITKIGDEYYDRDKATVGEESLKALTKVSETYTGLTSEGREEFLGRLKEDQAKAEEAVRKQSIANTRDSIVNNGLGDQMDFFGMILMAMFAHAAGHPELAAQIMNGFGGAGSGHTAGDRNYNGPASSGHRNGTGSVYRGIGGDTIGTVKPLHTGGLDVKAGDIASDELITKLAAQTGISAEMLRKRSESAASALNGLHPDIKAAALQSIHESWLGGKPVVLNSYDSIGEASDQFGFRGNGSFKNVDDRLARIIEETARDFPLRVRVMSGQVGRNSGDHAHGRAIDITLYDQDGNALGNYQNSHNFRAYELFAQAAYLKTKELYPQFVDGRGSDFNWGGHFGAAGKNNEHYKYGSADHMDFRFASSSRFRAGSIMNGLNAQHGWYDNGDILGGSKAYDPEVFAADMRKLETLRLTPQQAAHNKATLFGVGRSSGTLAGREDGYLNKRFLAFSVVPLDGQGNLAKTADAQTSTLIGDTFASYGFQLDKDAQENQLAFHVGPDTKSYIGLSTAQGSRKIVPGGLPVIPSEWKHASWEKAETLLAERRSPTKPPESVPADLMLAAQKAAAEIATQVRNTHVILEAEKRVGSQSNVGAAEQAANTLKKSGITMDAEVAEKPTVKAVAGSLKGTEISDSTDTTTADPTKGDKLKQADATTAPPKKPEQETAVSAG